MVNKAHVALTLIAGLSWGALAQGNIFHQADQAFHKRGNGFAAATAARDAYKKVINQARGNDLLYGVSQMARLDIYRGAMIPGVDLNTRKKVFDGCLDALTALKTTRSQQYYYFHTACLGFRGKLEGALGRIPYGLKMRGIQDEVLDATRNANRQLVGGFEGGGILRVLAALRGNRQAKPLGLYNPDEGVKFAELALGAAKQQSRPFPEALGGRDFFENYFYHGQALIALGIEKQDLSKVKAGQKIIGNSIAELNDLETIDGLPKGREPETAFYKREMVGLNKIVTQCAASATWKSCLVKELDKAPQ